MTNDPPRAQPSSHHTRSRQDEIIDAAAELFFEKGYGPTSMQAIAERIGILKGSHYHHITSKEDILARIFQDVHDGPVFDFDPDAHVDIADRIRNLVRKHVTHIAASQYKMGVFLQEFDSLSEEQRIPIIEKRHIYEAHVAELLAGGQREGVVSADLDPKIGAMGLLGAMNWVYRWYRPDHQYSPVEIADQLSSMVICRR